MPIRPENLARYPADWPEIRTRILERANYRCEFEGCVARHHELGYWNDRAWVSLPRELRNAGVDKPCVFEAKEGPLKVIRIVLTIAHLDHTPENCDEQNLRAWCQRHHLGYDAHHHVETAYMTRMRARNNLELFE